MRALSLPGCGCRGAFQFAVMARLAAAGERFDVVAGASSGSICAAVTVAGLAAEGPVMWRAMARTPVVSTRYLLGERSVFGMSVIVREALERFLPPERLQGTEAELLVATTHARRFARGLLTRAASQGPGPEAAVAGVGQSAKSRAARADRGLVVHSNREHRDMRAIIAASCYIPLLYARVPRLDGDVHVDGGAADNTLIDELLDRGATTLTVVTPYVGGAVSRTLFSPERPPVLPPHVRLRLIYPERTLTLRRFDFSPGPLEEALSMPHVVEELGGA